MLLRHCLRSFAAICPRRPRGAGFLVGSVIVSLAIYLLLWFLIARKASNVAKWVLVVFLVLSILSLVASLFAPGFTEDWTLTRILGLVVYALEIASLVYLFKPDAKAWLKGERAGDPAAFD